VLIVVIALAGGAVALTPPSSGQAPGAPSPACKQAKPHRHGALAKALSLFAAPNPVTAVAQVRVFGSLIGVHRGVKRCGEAIVLWRRYPNQLRFSPIARTLTTGSGSYSFVMPAGTVTTNRDWRVTATGLKSRTVTQDVRPVVTLTSTATFAVAGDRETLSGELEPARAGQVISLQRRTGARWTTVARPRLARSGSFSTPHTFTTGRTEQWRALAPATIHNLAADSSTLKIKIAPLSGIHKIRHVVIIMQENRSFDSYFGTFPGADGIPPGVCVPDPANGNCVAPFHDPADLNYGGPHSLNNALADIDNGRMDGYVAQAEQGMGCNSQDPNCSPCTDISHTTSNLPQCVDVMGYHDAREIPN
jgi:hypothetical protein